MIVRECMDMKPNIIKEQIVSYLSVGIHLLLK